MVRLHPIASRASAPGSTAAMKSAGARMGLRPGLARPAVVLIAMLAAAPAAAQTVHGTVTAKSTGVVISGAVVRLVQPGGQAASQVLTDAAGRFSLRAPGPGSYRLRVEQVGFTTELSDAFDLARDEVRDLPLAIGSQPLTLEGITVRGRSRGCSIRENGETVARVWEEARKALNGLVLSQSAGLVRFDIESFRRELDPVGGKVRSEDRHAAFDLTGKPYHSVPVQELEATGYVRMFRDSTIYFAPDAGGFLSDEFLDSHCFRIAGARGSDLIGLDFRPARRVSRPDVEGTLWLDRKTSELRAADFRFVGHPLDVPADQRRGRVEFERVPSAGVWFIRRWILRIPVLSVQKTRWVNPASRAVEERTETSVLAVVEQGGEVTTVSASGSTRRAGGRGSVSGMVVDSLTGKPLPGAFVYLSGTSHSDTTDASGRFGMENVPRGAYVVSFVHPRLSELGLRPPSRRVEVHATSPTTAELAVPAAATLVWTYCPANASEDEGMLIVHVKDRRTGAPVPGVHVQARWSEDSRIRPESMARTVAPSGAATPSVEGVRISATRRESGATTDDAGLVRICGLPPESSVELEARVRSSSRRTSLRRGSERISTHDLTINPQ